MRITKHRKRREQRERIAAAEKELLELQDGLRAAYSAFNHAADPVLAEAGILELSALQSRYGSTLRRLKELCQSSII